MTPPTKATDIQSHNDKSITLTQFNNFLLATKAGKITLVKQTNIPINYQPYWSPMRHVSGLTVKINPELVIENDHNTHIIKLHFGKRSPMTRIAAEQSLALLKRGFGNGPDIIYSIFDSYHSQIFYQEGDQKAAIERAHLSCQQFVSLWEEYKDSEEAA